MLFPFPAGGARTPEHVAQLPARTLAYIGDSVFELAMRLGHLESDLDPQGRLHDSVVGVVCAANQSRLFEALFQEVPVEEQALLKRWRNAKIPHRSGSATRAVYARSTAFEAFVGYLFLSGQHDRLRAYLSRCGPRTFVPGGKENIDEEPS